MKYNQLYGYPMSLLSIWIALEEEPRRDINSLEFISKMVSLCLCGS